MSNTVKLSICITTYNLKNVVNQTLESVFNQKTNYSFEVLIGDDGSDDGTIDEIKKWESKFPDIISVFVMDRDKSKKHDHNDHIVRASSNRYNLLKHAKGEYITFLDGDDFYVDENKIQKQIDLLETNLDCNFCAHNLNCYYESNNSIEPLGKIKFYNKIHKISFKEFWERGLYVSAESCIIRNNFDLAEANEKFYTNYFDDNFIVYMAFQKGKCFYIPDRMVNYRQHEGGYFNWDQTERKILDLLDIDAEINFAPKNKTIVLTRHYSSINTILNKKRINYPEKYPTIYMKAKKDQACITLKIMENKFSRLKWNLSKVGIVLKKIVYKIESFM